MTGAVVLKGIGPGMLITIDGYAPQRVKGFTLRSDGPDRPPVLLLEIAVTDLQAETLAVLKRRRTDR